MVSILVTGSVPVTTSLAAMHSIALPLYVGIPQSSGIELGRVRMV